MAEAKEFSLKPVEVQVIGSVQMAGTQALAAVVSGILVDRLAYSVTENTQFELEGGTNKIRVWEAEPTVEAGQPPDSVAAAMKGDK